MVTSDAKALQVGKDREHKVWLHIIKPRGRVHATA